MAAEHGRQRVEARSRARRRDTTIAIVVGIVAVILVALLVAVRLTTSDTTNAPGAVKPSGTVVSGELVYGDVIVGGSTLPAYPSDPSQADPALGKTAPTLQGDTFGGAPIRIASDGKPTVVMFVAHWCPHCQKEVPFLQQQFDTTGKPAGVQLFAVATATSADQPNYPPASWLVREGWTVETMVDSENGKAADAFGLSGYPFFVALDAQGRVVQRASGELSSDAFNALASAARSSGS